MKTVVSMIAFIFLSGCATGYQKQGLTGGFTETQLSENVWRVAFVGNGYTSREKAQDLAMLRSADLALGNGFRFFTLEDENSYVSSEVVTNPTTSTTTGSAYVYGNSVQSRAKTQTYGGQSVTVNRPTTTNTVVLYRDRPTGPGMVYDAVFICSSIGNKYSVSCASTKQNQGG